MILHAPPPEYSDGRHVAGILWYVASDSLGADRVIGTRLVQSFFNSLGERLEAPADFVFVNRGVFLTLDDSPILDSLLDLEHRGCRLFSCGTCIDYFQVRGRLAVGTVGSMVLLQELMLAAPKVVSL